MRDVYTEEEKQILRSLAGKPELNINGCSHSYRYYGVDRESNKEDIAILEPLIKRAIPNLASFSNFTDQTPNRVRMQTYWNPTFQGVHYIPLEELLSAQYSEEQP